MSETPEDSTPKPTSATDSSNTNNANTGNDGNGRERQHNVLQQVLNLLAEPVAELPEVERTDVVQGLQSQNQELRNVLSSMAGLLRDKSGQCLVLERKVSALTTQVASLKEVVALTKDLLNIRNMEVKHLKEDITNMEQGIENQRQRYNQMIGKLDQAFQLNSQLKEEYQTQLRIFQDLREKYELRAKLTEGAKKENESEAEQTQQI